MNQHSGNGTLATLKHRLQAWWTGDDEPAPDGATTPAEAPSPAGPEAELEELPGAARGWPAARIDLVQRLFGPGWHRPGGPAVIDALLGPLKLGDNSAVLVLGAGLGAVARAAGATGAQVTAIEGNVQLATAANRVADAGDGAQVSHGDYEKIKIQPASLDAVEVPESLHLAANRARILFAARKMLKLSGRLVMVDYFRRCQPDHPNYLVWASMEGIDAPLQTQEELNKELADMGFDIDSMDDITSDYRHRVLGAFSAHAQKLRQAPPAPDLRRLTLAEGELWTRRLALMEDGDLTVLRTVATVPLRG